MKKEKKSSSKLSKEIDNSLTKRAEAFIYEEMKKSIMSNPALMGQLTQSGKGSEKESIEID